MSRNVYREHFITALLGQDLRNEKKPKWYLLTVLRLRDEDFNCYSEKVKWFSTDIEATFILIICVACFSVYGSELRQL